MKKIAYISILLSFSLAVVGCSKEEPKTVAPSVAKTAPVKLEVKPEFKNSKGEAEATVGKFDPNFKPSHSKY